METQSRAAGLHDIPLEILDQLPRKARNPYKIRTAFSQLKRMKSGTIETRGCPEKHSEADLIRYYVEIEARARILTKGKILPLLNLPTMRLVVDGEKANRLIKEDRHRLRKNYGLGKREALYWKNMHLIHRPGAPHPKWFEFEQKVEAHMIELRSTMKEELFFLKNM